MIRYVVPVVAAKVATSGFFTGLPRNPFFFGVIRTLLVMLGLVHLTFTGVAGAVGVIVLDGAGAADVPAAFVAVTVNE